MKNIAVFLVLLVFCSGFFPERASAQTSRLYIAGYMGLSVPRDTEFSESSRPASGNIKIDNTQNFAGALGLRFSREFRVEAEIAYRKPSMDRIDVSGHGSFKAGGDLSSWTYMLNGYYDIDLGWQKLTPFVTAGLGLALHDAKILDSSGFAADALDNDWGLAYQAGSGLRYRLKKNVALTGSYRYLGTTEMRFDGYDFNFGSHEIRIGVEYDIPVK